MSAITRVANAFVTQHPGEASRILERMPAAESLVVLARLSSRHAVEALRRMSRHDAASILAESPDDLGKKWLEALDPVRAAQLVGHLDEGERERRMATLDPPLAAEIEAILTYPPGTAGSLMEGRVLTFDERDTVDEALTRLRGFGSRVTDLVICDADGLITGSVALQDAAAAEGDVPLGSLRAGDPVTVHVMASRDDVMELIEQHRLASLAVTDLDGRLVGVIRHNALVRAAQQDALADAQRMVGAGKEERALSTPWLAIKNRLPWLQINLATAFLASAVVGAFDSTIAQVTALAVLMPVVAGQSGNTGAQALAVTSRGLALREIRASHWFRVVRKEAVVGAGSGVAVALVTAAGVYAWSRNAVLAGVISVAMVLSMALAAVAGAIIPIVLTVLGRDPATAASIILTTVTDVVGFLSFLGFATLMLGALSG